MLSATPGGRLALVFSAPSVSPAPDEMGSAHSLNSRFLGAMCQIQSCTLHLVSHAYLPVRLAPSGHYTSERLTKPYSGELPACAVPSQLANIARLPMPKGPRGQPTPQPRGHCSNCEKPSPRTIATVFSSMTAMAYFRPSSTDPLNTWNCLYLKHHPEVPRLTASVNGSSVRSAENALIF